VFVKVTAWLHRLGAQRIGGAFFLFAQGIALGGNKAPGLIPPAQDGF
jgi:hypothetical protein